MTEINLATDTPASIETVEQALLWLASLQESLLKGSTYREAQGSSIDSGLAPLVDASIVSAADGSKRCIVRLAIELHPDYVSDKSKKFWLFAQPMTNAVIPAAFKVD